MKVPRTVSTADAMPGSGLHVDEQHPGMGEVKRRWRGLPMGSTAHGREAGSEAKPATDEEIGER